MTTQNSYHNNTPSIPNNGRKKVESRLASKLNQRHHNGTLRAILPLTTTYTTTRIDFSSNDYLGLANCPHQLQLVDRSFRAYLSTASTSSLLPKLGSTGSRLLSGNALLPRTIEHTLSLTHQSPDALLFNSGYDANLSVMGSIPLRGDVVLLDELVHNSLVMGVRMGRVEERDVVRFRHNCVKDLEEKLSCFSDRCSSSSVVFLVVESVYSMDGDIAPLPQILALAERYGAVVVVDEAHALGVYGVDNADDLPLGLRRGSEAGREEEGKEGIGGQKERAGGLGVLSALNLQSHPSLLATVCTFGKAAGCHGAVVLASSTTVQYLVNYARPFVYSTSLPPHSLLSILKAYATFTGTEGWRRRRLLFGLIRRFRDGLKDTVWDASFGGDGGGGCEGPIQTLEIRGGGNEQCIALAEDMRERGGFEVYAIRSPTVEKGRERVRVVLHSFNTVEEVDGLVAFLKEVEVVRDDDGGGGRIRGTGMKNIPLSSSFGGGTQLRSKL